MTEQMSATFGQHKCRKKKLSTICGEMWTSHFHLISVLIMLSRRTIKAQRTELHQNDSLELKFSFITFFFVLSKDG